MIWLLASYHFSIFSKSPLSIRASDASGNNNMVIWRIIILVAVSIAGFINALHFPLRQRLFSHHDVGCCLWHRNDDNNIICNTIPISWSQHAITATLIATLGGYASEANALDMPASFTTLQTQEEVTNRVATSIDIAAYSYQNRNSVDVMQQYQSLLLTSSDTSVVAETQISLKKNELKTSDIQNIVKENKIDVELVCTDDQRPLDVNAPIVKIDRESFVKVKIYQPPFLQYLPSNLQPLVSKQFKSFQVLKSIPNDQLFVASVFAGSLTESVRVVLLYPLSTVKSRVQARTTRMSSTNQKRSLIRKLKLSWLTFVKEAKKNDLYAGLLPSLFITVVSSGVYAGAKDVSRRAFVLAVQLQVVQDLFPPDNESSYYSALVVNLLAAFVADIAALAVRTPADVLTLRLQVFGNSNVRSDYSSWLKDSVALLPAMIVTDTPFLLSRIFLNAAVTTQGEDLGRYEFETIGVACLCAFLTTPFDVTRTRILLPTLPSEEEEEEDQMERVRRLVASSSKDREQRRQKLSVLGTMRQVAAEGNGGVSNLFAGWIERSVYLGIGRSWLDPLRVIGYIGIRDALLLKLFD